MPKKYSTTTTLVIVESPSKCKKIEEYLGPGYKCVATYGHLREITSLTNIDIENNFAPTYTIINNSIKKKQIEFLRKAIKESSEVILGCDNDREGEKIAYCVAQLFNLDINNTKRITFNEITKIAIKNAIQNPRTIDMNLVHAQQARQILDLLVGFKVSPILWKFITKNKENSLSAGRCQTPALMLIYENDQEIKNYKEKKVYNTTGYFTNLNIAFELNEQYETENDIINFLEGSINYSHIYTCTKPNKIFKKPPEPFTTSKLQQVASNELHYSPKETMRICQILYEEGYITYMRTDSMTYSKDFIELTKEYILRNYDVNYINGDVISGLKKESTKKISTQEAHEAIRPTDISLIELSEKLDSKERKLYKLIWTNTLESCMSSASFYSITANISAFKNLLFTYTSELIDFPGWKIVMKKYLRENKEYQYLQQIKQNQIISYKKICSKITLKDAKQHYTEARLVNLLENNGIGRPSTFSSLIDKIQERGYVKKEDIIGKEILCNDIELENGTIYEFLSKREFGNEKGKLIIQQLGNVVIDFLQKHFNDLFNYNYTNLMEKSLDKIAKGEMRWVDLCDDCNKQIDNLINQLKDETKIEIKIDDNNIYLIGKYGPIIKCVEELDGKEEFKFKPIRNDIDIKNLQKGHYTADEIIDTNKITKKQYILGQYNGNDVILQKGKFGLYITWGTNSKTLKELGNRPIENITFDEVQMYLEEGSNLIRVINPNLSIRKGSKGDYLFYKTLKMKKPQFYDIKGFNENYKICDIHILKEWIKNKYSNICI